ncbi:molybdate ABC transporter substrate-binding protein [Myxococcota bacterium]|nr:molybdate ABC transporter substrate-binding protein [Myxococcota bacterium]
MQSSSAPLTLLCSLAASLGLAGCAAPPAPEAAAPTVAVVAASDLQHTFDALREGFAEAHPEVLVTVSYGASGSLTAQLSQGAPFDVFFSADMAYPESLAAAGLVTEAGVRPYATGALVVWAPPGSPAPLAAEGAAALKSPSVKHVAVANPQHAPYGRAAVAAIRSLGLEAEVTPKLVFGENVSQTAQLTQSGAAELGLISRSMTLAPATRGQGVVFEVPTEHYPPIVQGVAVLRRAAAPEAAEALVTFVRSPEGQAILSAHGFAPAEPPTAAE